MAIYRLQIKQKDGTAVDLPLNADTLDGKESSHYLDYDNLINKPTIPAKVEVDSEISSESENPVESKAIYEALAKKQDVLSSDNSQETNTDLSYGTSSNYDVTSDTQLPTTKATKKIVDNAISTKANSSDVFTKTETENLINESLPTKTSELTNDSGFITKAVSDLVNYYKKNETYTQTEINNLISAIPKFNILVVTSLPTSNISSTTIYLKKENEDSGNLYTEYIYTNNAWEILGSQKVDLTGYATEQWVEGKGYLIASDIIGKVDKTTTINGKALSSNIELSKSDIGLGNVDNTSDLNKPISTATQNALDLKEDKSNLGELAYKDNLSKSDVGLSNVNNVAITQDEVTQITTNKNNITTYKNQMSGLEDRVTLLEENGTGGSGESSSSKRTYNKQLYGSEWLRIAKVDDVAKNSSGIFTLNCYGINELGVKSILTTSVFSVSCGLDSEGNLSTDVFPITQTPEIELTASSGSSGSSGGSSSTSGGDGVQYGLSNIKLEQVPYDNTIYAMGLFSFPISEMLYSEIEIEMKIENNLNFAYLDDIYAKEIEDENAIVEGMEIEDNVTYVTTLENTVDNWLSVSKQYGIYIRDINSAVRISLFNVNVSEDSDGNASGTNITIWDKSQSVTGGGLSDFIKQLNIIFYETDTTDILDYCQKNVGNRTNQFFYYYCFFTKVYLTTTLTPSEVSIYKNGELLTDYSSIEISSNDDKLTIQFANGQSPDHCPFTILGSSILKVYSYFDKERFGGSIITTIENTFPETFTLRIVKEVTSKYSGSYELYSPYDRLDKIDKIDDLEKHIDELELVSSSHMDEINRKTNWFELTVDESKLDYTNSDAYQELLARIFAYFSDNYLLQNETLYYDRVSNRKLFIDFSGAKIGGILVGFCVVTIFPGFSTEELPNDNRIIIIKSSEMRTDKVTIDGKISAQNISYTIHEALAENPTINIHSKGVDKIKCIAYEYIKKYGNFNYDNIAHINLFKVIDTYGAQSNVFYEIYRKHLSIVNNGSVLNFKGLVIIDTRTEQRFVINELPSNNINKFSAEDIVYVENDYVTAPQDLRTKTINPTYTSNSEDSIDYITFDDMDYSNKVVNYSLNSDDNFYTYESFGFKFPNKIVNSKILIHHFGGDTPDGCGIQFQFDKVHNMKIGADMISINSFGLYTDKLEIDGLNRVTTSYGEINQQSISFWVRDSKEYFIFELVFDEFGDVTITPMLNYKEI